MTGDIFFNNLVWNWSSPTDMLLFKFCIVDSNSAGVIGVRYKKSLFIEIFDKFWKLLLSAVIFEVKLLLTFIKWLLNVSAIKKLFFTIQLLVHIFSIGTLFCT